MQLAVQVVRWHGVNRLGHMEPRHGSAAHPSSKRSFQFHLSTARPQRCPSSPFLRRPPLTFRSRWRSLHFCQTAWQTTRPPRSRTRCAPRMGTWKGPDRRPIAHLRGVERRAPAHSAIRDLYDAGGWSFLRGRSECREHRSVPSRPNLSPRGAENNAALPDRFRELRLKFEKDFALVVRAYDEGATYRFVTQRPDSNVVEREEATFDLASGNAIGTEPPFLLGAERGQLHHAL